MGIQLRSYVFIDQMQPQFAAYLASVAKGFLPKTGMASMFIEIAPGMPINKLIDIALKQTSVQPAEIIVERAFGMLELHHESQSEVRAAGEAILKELNMRESDRIKPKIVTNEIIKKVDDYQSMVINRQRRGQMLLHNHSLLILETEPAAYIAFAANEAEKAANVSTILINAAGKYGRLYMGGEEADVQAAAEAAVKALNNLTGKEQ